MAGKVSVLGICAIPCALTAELPKLDMNNGPTLSGWTISFYKHTTV